MIPEEAVEAAARALSIHTMVDDSPENEKFREAVRNEARLALEAAAPHMLAAAWEQGWDSFASFDSRPGGPYPTKPVHAPTPRGRMKITDFLEARIAEDETTARLSLTEGVDLALETFDEDERDATNVLVIGKARVLAECAAKRAIIAECRPGTLDDLDSGEDDQPAPMWVARALATVYKDHPDYRQEWAL